MTNKEEFIGIGGSLF